MGDRGAPGGAWGARDDTSWWPSNTGEIQHQQQINEEIARSTASSTHQLYTYKMAGSFNNDSGDNSNTNYEYRIISTTQNREESNQQPWWFTTGAVESQQISSSPTGQNQASPEPEQSNPQSKSLQQQQQQQQQQHQQQQQEQNNSIRQQLQQRHELQQAFEQQQQSIQQSQLQQAIQQNQQQLQQMQQNSQQTLQQQTLQQMLQQQQQQQQQVLQQAIQQQTITQAQAQAIVQQAQAALQQQVSQLQQQQSLQDQLQQHRDIQAFQRQSANIQDQHPVQQVLINQTANKPRMPRARAFNKPRGRMTAYAFFVQTCREEHKKSNPEDNVVFTLFSKKCAERWSTMNEKEKLRFHEMAELDKQRYDVEMQSYVPPKDVKLPKGRKRNQTKDPNAPKRSLSAFFWFCNDERSKVKAGNPEYTMGDIAKELGRRWAAADAGTKSKYEKLSEQDKARYDREMLIYKKGGLALTQPPQDKQEVNQAVARYDVHDAEYK